MSSEDTVPFYQNPNLCQLLLSEIVTSNTLQVRESRTPGAGSGLFADNAVPAGQEVFRSKPVVTCVQDSLSTVCDFCYTNNASKVLPSGRFRTRRGPIEALVECNGCHICKYCTESCRNTAFEAYHKYECAAFLKSGGLGIRARALYRALIHKQHGLLPEHQWQGLMTLMPHQSGHQQGPEKEALSRIAMEAKAHTDAALDIDTIERLYCVSAVMGTVVDVVGAIMNHSCDPNVLISFDGNELVVRTLRAMEAGDELAHCYTDVQSDVLLRQKLLQSEYFFTCTCPRCQSELREHECVTRGDNAKMQTIRVVQDNLFANSLADHMEELADKAYPTGEWPPSLEPLPSIYKTLGRLNQAQGDPFGAIEYCIRGCAYTKRRAGEPWMVDLFELVQVLTAVLGSSPEEQEADEPAFPTPAELWDVFHGYLHELLRLAQGNCGHDVSYTRAIRSWHDAALKYADGPLPGTQEFADKFHASHRKLLLWANVTEDQWTIDT
ncbi:SET and MYND domain protein [Apiospora saccharicola]